jgi:hypothetical protein
VGQWIVLDQRDLEESVLLPASGYYTFEYTPSTSDVGLFTDFEFEIFDTGADSYQIAEISLQFGYDVPGINPTKSCSVEDETPDSPDGQGVSNVADNDPMTKYVVITKDSCPQNAVYWYPEVAVDIPFRVTSYFIITADDAATSSEKNIYTWEFQAKEGTTWRTLDSVSNSTALPAVNNAKVLFSPSSIAPAVYSQFRLLIVHARSGEFQIAEVGVNVRYVDDVCAVGERRRALKEYSQMLLEGTASASHGGRRLKEMTLDSQGVATVKFGGGARRRLSKFGATGRRLQVGASKFNVKLQAFTLSDLGTEEYDYAGSEGDNGDGGKDNSSMPWFIMAICGVVLLAFSITRKKRASGEGIFEYKKKSPDNPTLSEDKASSQVSTPATPSHVDPVFNSVAGTRTSSTAPCPPNVYGLAESSEEERHGVLLQGSTTMPQSQAHRTIPPSQISHPLQLSRSGYQTTTHDMTQPQQNPALAGAGMAPQSASTRISSTGQTTRPFSSSLTRMAGSVGTSIRQQRACPQGWGQQPAHILLQGQVLYTTPPSQVSSIPGSSYVPGTHRPVPSFRSEQPGRTTTTTTTTTPLQSSAVGPVQQHPHDMIAPCGCYVERSSNVR